MTENRNEETPEKGTVHGKETGQPESGDQSGNPSGPGKPGEPVKPATTTAAGKSSGTGNPSGPGKPGEPVKPATTTAAGKSSGTDNPSGPGKPGEPVKPATTDAAGKSSGTGNPSGPGKPGEPVKPATTAAAGKPKGNKLPVGLIAIAVVLAGILIYVIVAYQKQKTSMYEMERMLTHEKDSLANELQMMIFGYDTLKTNNDTLNAELVREQNRIRQLLSINASNVQLIRQYRAEIGTMRDIMKSYIVQIDSLNTRNRLLVAENEEIRGQITKVTQTNIELEKTREDLSAKVVKASVIQAKDVVVNGINTKRREVDRIDRLDKLRVCFTLRENPIAEAGRKTVFLRVLRPDGLVITDSPENIFQVDEENIIFTANRDVDYENQDIEMCIFVDNTGDFIAGVSSVELYLEGVLIGSSTFSLRGR